MSAAAAGITRLAQQSSDLGDGQTLRHRRTCDQRKQRHEGRRKGRPKQQSLMVSSGQRRAASIGCSPSLSLCAGRRLTLDESALQRVDLVALSLDALKPLGALTALSGRRRLCLLQRGPSPGLPLRRGLELIGRARTVRMARAQHGLHQPGLGQRAQQVRVG
jgi:hypothetical protein